MIVVDTNIIVYSVIQLPQSVLAAQVAARDAEWVLPTLWRYEFTSAVVKMTRGGAINDAQAAEATAAANALVAERELDVDQLLAYRTAISLKLSAYDANYVALARSLGIRCVTADGALVRNAPGIAISLADFAGGAPPS